MANDTMALLRGQIASFAGTTPGDGRPSQFATAEALFAARRGMRLASLVAGYGNGLCAGGEAGQRRIDETQRLMEAEGIRRPAGFIRLFAPALDGQVNAGGT